MTGTTPPSTADFVRAFRHALQDETKLLATIDRLYQGGEITDEHAERLRAVSSAATTKTRYILRHLAVHLGIGASKVIVPLPIGAFLRGSWVAIARTSETIRGRRDHARIHSLPVFLTSCIPFAGYVAYIIALREHDPDVAFLYANHISVLRYGCALEKALLNKPRLLQAIVRHAVGTATRG